MRSFALILLALGLTLSAPNLSAKENLSESRNNPPSEQPSPKQPVNRQPDRISGNPKQQPYNEQRGTEDAPFVIKLHATEHTYPSAKENAEDGKEGGSYSWNPLTWSLSQQIAAIASVAGLLQFLILIATWWIMRCTARSQLRAYMGVATVKIIHTQHVHPLRGIVSLKNFGQTMAKDVEVWIAGDVEVFKRKEFPLGDRKFKTVVMPTEGVNFEESITFTADSLELMNNGCGNALLWGRITYTDVFGKNRWTTFRFITYEREGNGWKTRTCDEGNDAD